MKKLFFIAIICILESNVLFGQRKIYNNKAQSQITYFMDHPLHSWQGTSKEINCVATLDDKINKIVEVVATARVNSFDSGISARDSQVMNVLEGDKIPNVSFKSTKVIYDNNNILVIGDLTFHGITKATYIKLVQDKKNNQQHFNGELGFKLSEHDVKRSALMGMKISDIIILKMDIIFDN